MNRIVSEGFYKKAKNCGNTEDGNYLTDSTSAILQAYLDCKDHGRIQAIPLEGDDPNDFIITSLDLIKELDGNRFANWLKK